MSQFRVELAGDETFMGWDRNTTALAALYDITAAKAKGKRLKDKERFPVPEAKKKKPVRDKPVKSVRDLDWKSMLGEFGG